MNEKHFIAPNIRGVALVGVGGTGSYLAQGLAKMIAGYKLDTKVALIDPDTIEEKNRFRQNFMPWEIGMNKAEALAFRLNQQFGLAFAAFPCAGEEISRQRLFEFNLIVTCVDKIAPRKLFRDVPLWLDSGNELDYGQVIFGTTALKKKCKAEIQAWDKSPHVTVLPNAFLKAGMTKMHDSNRTASCADTPFAEQGCFINEVAAQGALMILHQLLVIGMVTTPALYFDTTKARLVPARITKNYLSC